MAKSDTIFGNEQCILWGKRILRARSLKTASRLLYLLAKTLPEGSQWRRFAIRAARYVRSVAKGKPDHRHNVFQEGNGKLPFWAFATLSIVDCPDAGECATWCYSRRAWRYPAAFFRQLVNSLLMKHAPEVISSAFRALPHGAIVRLYTDGDFSGPRAVKFWFAELNARQDVKAYGYSKGWDILFAECAHWPANYVLNLSSGGRAQTVSAEEMISTIPNVRGWFAAVDAGKDWVPAGTIGNIGTKRYSLSTYHVAVRETYREETGAKAFSCPGKCGDCRVSAGMHACGDASFTVPIAIGIH